MKTTLTVILALSFMACVFPQPDYDEPVSATISKLPKSADKSLCGLYDFPHGHEPISCGANPWTHKGVCCTWITEEYYRECITAWCLNEYLCEWHVNQHACNPI